jgi:hypothetical protein
MKTLVTLALALAALALPAFQAVSAKENYHEKALNADTREKFEVVVENVRKDMEKGGRYEYVQPKERVQIDQNLTAMTALFDQYGSISAMNQDTKIKLFNAQEVVNSILTKRDRDRVICKNEAPVGSHIPVTSCHTYAQEVEAREGTKTQLDEWKRVPCVATPSSNGTPPPTCYMGPGAGR